MLQLYLYYNRLFNHFISWKIAREIPGPFYSIIFCFFHPFIHEIIIFVLGSFQTRSVWALTVENIEPV